MLTDFEKTSSSLPFCKPYCDPALIRNRHAYGKFVKRLLDAGVRELGPRARHTVGIFFVTKNQGLRLVFDTRAVNRRVREPPHTNLPSAGAWSRIEVEDGNQIHVAESDIADAFYRISLPHGLSSHFVLPKIETRFIPDLSAQLRDQLGAWSCRWAGRGPCIFAR